MKSTVFIAAFCISVAAVASGQAFAQTAQTETKYVTVDGDVVRYDAGQVIVIRGADSKETTYTLSPTIVVPAEVAVGRRVTLYTEPGKDGATQLVSRVTTTSVTPEGNVQRTTEDTRRLPSGATSLTTTTNISGRVEAYEAGKTLTVTRSDGSKVTYLLTEKSQVPAGMMIGKTVTIVPMATTGAAQPVADTITYVTTTQTRHLPSGATARTTIRTRTARTTTHTTTAGRTIRTSTARTSGKVEAYEAGKTVTIMQSNGRNVTYRLTDESKVPAGMMIGKTISIRPVATTGSSEPVAHTITYVTTTKTTKTETVPVL